MSVIVTYVVVALASGCNFVFYLESNMRQWSSSTSDAWAQIYTSSFLGAEADF